MLPRVRLTYPFQTDAGIQERELPFVVGILADLGSGEGAPMHSCRFLDIDRTTFASVMERAGSRVVIRHQTIEIELRFRSMNDFEPDALLRQCGTSGLSLRDIQRWGAFRRIEATWRGIHYLVFHTEPSDAVRFRVLDVTHKMLSRDLESAPAFDHSFLFKHVHEKVYGSYEGEPFGLLVADFAFGFRQREDSIRMLEQLSRIAAAINAPIVAAAQPHLVGAEYFDIVEKFSCTELSQMLDYPSPAFRAFQASADSRYACLVLPQVLWRIENEIWGNAAFVAAARITDSFVRHGWCSEIQGEAGGGLSADLPMTRKVSATGEGNQVGSTDIALDDMQEHILSAYGFACLTRLKDRPGACFRNLPTCRNLGQERGEAPWPLIRHDQMRYVLTVSRFAHYLRMIACSRLSKDRSREERELELNAWMQRYVSSAPADLPARARYPLREARVELTESGPDQGPSGVAFLRPDFLSAADDGSLLRVELGPCGLR
jgi:type VI secretion system protein ImpC